MGTQLRKWNVERRQERGGEARKRNHVCCTTRIFSARVLLTCRASHLPYLVESPRLCKDISSSQCHV